MTWQMPHGYLSFENVLGDTKVEKCFSTKVRLVQGERSFANITSTIKSRRIVDVLESMDEHKTHDLD